MQVWTLQLLLLDVAAGHQSTEGDGMHRIVQFDVFFEQFSIKIVKNRVGIGHDAFLGADIFDLLAYAAERVPARILQTLRPFEKCFDSGVNLGFVDVGPTMPTVLRFQKVAAADTILSRRIVCTICITASQYLVESILAKMTALRFVHDEMTGSRSQCCALSPLKLTYAVPASNKTLCLCRKPPAHGDFIKE
uniref:Secreted protein n=1 Tax=Romanomermis culicivorax TaxID=13658 RepID=A0A915I0Z1_ROMCU